MRIVFILFIFCSTFLVSCSSSITTSLDPVNLDRKHSCAQDGMVIIEYVGPKAQIIWKDGHRTFYCEAREVFDELFDDVKNKQIRTVFVQDFTNLEWGTYIDKWVNITEVFFVVDSDIVGAMGLSYVPFSTLDAAKCFYNNHGGEIFSFVDITKDILFHSNELLKQRILFEMT